MTIEKAKSFYDEVHKTDKWTFSEGRSKKITCKNISQHKYCLIIQNIW